MQSAVVHIGLVGGAQIVNDFYQFSRLETVGPGQIETGVIRTFSTLEGLVDGILASGQQVHVVVNHGNPQQGLLIRFTSTSPHNATGPMANALGELVNALAQGTLPPLDFRLLDAAAKMGVDPAMALQLLGRFVQLRQQQRMLHFRGCNLGQNTSMLHGYKLMFNASVITAPTTRMFYIRVHPRRPPAGTSIGQLAGQRPSTPTTRRRLFAAPSDGSAGPLLVDIRDIDGHTSVESPLSVLDSPAQAPRWGTLLTGRWTNTANPSFVLPVLWNNAESSFHCPLEEGYRQRLTLA